MSKITFKKLFPAILWLLIIITLLSLPGSAFPSQNWMSKIQFDKWIHIFIFFILTFLFCLPLRSYKEKTYRYFILYISIATLLSIIIGIIMEYVQKYYIPNRSFDVWDIVTDTVGSVLGCIYCLRWHKKASIEIEAGN